MQNEPILVIMAAGMGSRYGGLKQMDPVGPCGEVILHYSIFDAKRAGFRRVIFVIKREMEADFRKLVGDPVSAHMEVRYAFQDIDRLPKPFAVPAGRVKPWGTGHAVLCCRDLIDAPFMAINADDYYGTEAFRLAYQSLTKPQEQEKLHCMMVGYRLDKTTTPSGYVSRGICDVDGGGFLRKITETTHIVESCDGPLYTLDGQTYNLLARDTVVSMNLWGFPRRFMDELENMFPLFLEQSLKENPLKAEFYLPSAVEALVAQGKAEVEVLRSPDKWYGVTYHADRAEIMSALAQMTGEGLYPMGLWA